MPNQDWGENHKWFPDIYPPHNPKGEKKNLTFSMSSKWKENICMHSVYNILKDGCLVYFISTFGTSQIYMLVSPKLLEKLYSKQFFKKQWMKPRMNIIIRYKAASYVFVY